MPSDVQLVLMINRWINPWHACQDLEKIIPFKEQLKNKGENSMKTKLIMTVAFAISPNAQQTLASQLKQEQQQTTEKDG